MPREAAPVKLAEKVLLLTHALLSAARREDWDDFHETLRAREAAVADLATRPLDQEATRILEHALQIEPNVTSAIKGSQGKLVSERAVAFRKGRGLAGYGGKRRAGGLLDRRS